MNFNILIVLFFSIICIGIIHVLIKQLLIKNKLYTLHTQNELDNLPKVDTTEQFIDTTLSDSNMKQYLLDYMKHNHDIYQEKNNIYLENIEDTTLNGSSHDMDYANSNLKNENNHLEQYFKPVVNIEKELNLPNYELPPKTNQYEMNRNELQGWDNMNTNSLYSDIQSNVKCSDR